jgi:hypothetical protein
MKSIKSFPQTAAVSFASWVNTVGAAAAELIVQPA